MFLNLHRSGWIQNLVAGIAVSLVVLALSVLMNGKQSIVLVGAFGLTIIVWIVAFEFYGRLGSADGSKNLPKPPQITKAARLDTPTIIAKQDKAQTTLDAILAKMDVHQKRSAPDLAREFPLGYSIFTMNGRNEIIPYKPPPVLGGMLDWNTVTIEVSSQMIMLHLPDIEFPNGGHMKSCSVGLKNQAGASIIALSSGNEELVFKLIDSDGDDRIAVAGLRIAQHAAP